MNNTIDTNTSDREGPWAEDHFKAEYENIKDSVTKLFNAHKTAPFIAWLFANLNPATMLRERTLIPIIFEALPDLPGSKDVVAEKIRSIAKQVDAVAIVISFEGWFVSAKSKKNMPRGSLEFVPGRKEGLVVMFESVSYGKRQCRALIERDSKGDPVLHPWEEAAAETTEGRFTDLLPHLN